MSKKELVRQYRQSLISAHIKDGAALAEYFLYFAPGIDSALSHESISSTHEDEVANLLLKSSRAAGGMIQIGNRRAYSRTKEDMSAVVFKTPSIYCHLKKHEGKASCLLRHLRNAIAHGEVYIKILKNNSSQICFLDYDRDGKPSAQIVITRAILREWKESLMSLEADWLVPKGDEHVR